MTGVWDESERDDGNEGPSLEHLHEPPVTHLGGSGSRDLAFKDKRGDFTRPTRPRFRTNHDGDCSLLA